MEECSGINGLALHLKEPKRRKFIPQYQNERDNGIINRKKKQNRKHKNHKKVY